MEPYDGSLTRLGGALEYDFGWNKRLETFADTSYITMEKPYLVPKEAYAIVLGTSFTMSPRITWTNYFVYDQKLKILVVHLASANLNEIIDVYLASENPPKFLLIESFEPDFLKYIFKVSKQIEKMESLPLLSVPVKHKLNNDLRDFSTKPFFVSRSKNIKLKERFRLAGDYIYKKIFGRLLSVTKVIAINCEHCFSSNIKDKMLIFSSSLSKSKLAMGKASQAAEKIGFIKNIIESNGATKFGYMIMPYKINIYTDYASNINPPTLYHSVLNQEENGFINVRAVLMTAVKKGVSDIYLPNDHHYGADGSRLTAKLVANILLKEGSN
ncbi:MAG: hypothetical protein QM504_02395 [Pseudomonadota bacterium]